MVAYMIPLQNTGVIRIRHPAREGEERQRRERERNRILYERLLKEPVPVHPRTESQPVVLGI